jgi:hypothetical protein
MESPGLMGVRWQGAVEDDRERTVEVRERAPGGGNAASGRCISPRYTA